MIYFRVRFIKHYSRRQTLNEKNSSKLRLYTALLYLKRRELAYHLKEVHSQASRLKRRDSSTQKSNDEIMLRPLGKPERALG